MEVGCSSRSLAETIHDNVKQESQLGDGGSISAASFAPSSGVVTEVGESTALVVSAQRQHRPSGGQQANAPCPGCSRTFGVSKSFLNPDEPVEWARSNGLGKWCGDCFSCHRTLFSTTHPLIIFGQFLENKTNFQDWEWLLVASMTLRKEDHAKITTEMIQERKALLQWVFGMFNVPLKPFAVVPLADIAAKAAGFEHLFGHVRSSQLISIRASGATGLQLGVVVEDMDIAPDARVKRPNIESGAMLVSRSTVGTQLRTDLEYLHAEMGGEQPRALETALQCWQAAGDVQPTKLQAKQFAVIDLAKNALKVFEAPGTWKAAKEASLTAPLTKLLAVHSEASTQGIESISNNLDKWQAGVQSAKQFLKHYRDYGKTKFSDKKLLQFGTVVTNLVSFLSGIPVIICGDLQLLSLKVLWLQSKSGTLKGRVDLITDNGLRSAFESLASGSDGQTAEVDEVTLGGWLRSVVFPFIKCEFEKMTVEDLEPSREGWIVDLHMAMDTLLLKLEPFQTQLQEFLGDVRAFKTHLEAGAESSSVSARSASEALEILKCKRNEVLKRMLDESPVGAEINQTAAMLRQRDAKDELGVTRFLAGLQAVSDARCPQVTLALVSEDDEDDKVDINITHAELFGGEGEALSTLQDSISNVQEAVGMWSAVCQEENVDEMDKWLEHSVHIAGAGDACAIAEFFTKIKSIIETIRNNDSAMGLAFGAKAYADLAAALDEEDFTRPGFAEFAKTLVAFVCGNSAISKHEQVTAHVEATLKENADRRSLFMNFCKALGKAGVSIQPDVTSRSLLDGWEAARRTEPAALDRIIQLRTTLRALQKSSVTEAPFVVCINPAGDEALVTLEYELASGKSKISIDFAEVQALFFSLPSLGVVEHLVGILCSTEELVISRFVESLHLDAMLDRSAQNSAERFDALALFQKCFNVDRAVALIVDAEAAVTDKGIEAFQAYGFFALMQQLAASQGALSEAGFELKSNPGLFAADGFRGGDTYEAEVILLMGDIYKDASCALGCAALFCHRFAGKSAEMMDSELRIKRQVAACMDLCAAALMRIQRNIPQAMDKAHTVASWAVAIPKVQSWAEAMSVAVGTAKREILKAAATSGLSFAEALKERIPQYTHFLNDTCYTKSLAKKNLLLHPNRQSLAADCAKLWHCVHSASAAATSWGLPALNADSAFTEEVQTIDAVIKDGRLAVAVIAGVNVVQELSGSQQATQAAALIDMNIEGLPKMLVAAVTELSRKAGPPQGAVAKRPRTG